MCIQDITSQCGMRVGLQRCPSIYKFSVLPRPFFFCVTNTPFALTSSGISDSSDSDRVDMTSMRSPSEAACIPPLSSLKISSTLEGPRIWARGASGIDEEDMPPMPPMPPMRRRSSSCMNDWSSSSLSAGWEKE